MDEPPATDGPESLEQERSRLGPLGSALAVGLLLAALVGGGYLLLQAGQAPATLSRSDEGLVLSWEEGPSLPVLLGPGCVGPGLAEGDLPALTWLGRGQPFVAPLGAREAHYFIGSLTTSAAEAASQSLILMPGGRCRLLKSSANLVLKVERWEGAFRDGVCVVWVYSHPDWLLAPEVEFDDGASLSVSKGRPLGVGWSSDGSWSLTEYGLKEGSSREITYSGEKDTAVYLLTQNGKTEQALLQRTSQSTWSPGDPAPESKAH